MCQLQDYGMTSIAQVIAESSQISFNIVKPSSKLAELAFAGSMVIEGGDDEIVARRSGMRDDDDMGDLDMDVKGPAKVAPNYTLWFTTQHRGAARTAAFSPDGNYIATGSSDASLKVLDVSKIHMAHRESGSGDNVEKPVVRTYYDHSLGVNEVAFHPNGVLLASCSDDMHIKMYDLQRPNVKRGFRYFQDAFPIRSIHFHPSGDFLLAGTDHECPRIYDVNTFKCYIPNMPSDTTRGAINKVRFAPKGNMFVTGGTDGSIKLFDTVSSKVTNTIPSAHSDASISSLEFSKNGKYILSAGQDSRPRLWDIVAGKVLHTFEGTNHISNHIEAVFSFNDDYVISTDEINNTIVLWDVRTGAMLKKYIGGQQALVRGTAASPVDYGFITCSDDCRARYYNVD
ncbi:hypothetical protein HDV05_006699 [Chytridiales sp. JEL 0842]|nr:hypothetical protein HDV05_006699 [Chytridiales sp. JEL 0842]